MLQQLEVALNHQDSPVNSSVFDRAVLDRHTMGDASLADEILNLFLGQLANLARADWASLDLVFEMHTLRGAAAAVGAMRLYRLAQGWRDEGEGLEAAIKAAIREFNLVADAN